MIERLTLLWRRFSPLEEHLLSAVRGVLPPEAQPILDAQVAAITLVQRSPPSWTEICFYRLRHGKTDWSGVPMFPCSDEFRLADVTFRATSRRFKATLTSIGGHIFDFATTPGPRAAAFAPWETEPTVALLADPMRAPTGSRVPERLPPLWQEVLGAHGGQATAGWVLHDAATAYRLTLDCGVHLVLAERDGEEFVLQRIDPEDGVLLYLEQHDGVPEPLTGGVEILLAGRRTSG